MEEKVKQAFQTIKDNLEEYEIAEDDFHFRHIKTGKYICKKELNIIEYTLNRAEETENELENQNKILKEELNAVNDFRTHYKIYQEKLANNLKVINSMQEEETTNRNLIDSLEDRNDRLVERLEKQKAELNELKEFCEILCKMKIVDSNHKIYGINEKDIALIKRMVEKYGN